MKNQVRQQRERLTQKEQEEKVGVSRQTIIAVETGEFDPSIHLAHRLVSMVLAFIGLRCFCGIRKWLINFSFYS